MPLMFFHPTAVLPSTESTSSFNLLQSRHLTKPAAIPAQIRAAAVPLTTPLVTSSQNTNIERRLTRDTALEASTDIASPCTIRAPHSLELALPEGAAGTRRFL